MSADFSSAVEQLSETGLSVRRDDRGLGYIAVWPCGFAERFSSPLPNITEPELQEISSPEWYANMLDGVYAYYLKAPVWKPN